MTAVQRNALILGASSAMGKAITEVLLDSGVAVFLTFNAGQDGIDDLIKKSEREELLLGYSQLSAEDDQALPEILKGSFKNKPLNIVINCIGVAEITKISQPGAIDKWQRSISINLDFLFRAAHFTLPMLKKSGWGRWINISSVSAFERREGVCCYSVTKAAENKLIEFMAREAGQYVTANSICPGMTNTPHLAESNQRLAEERGVSVEAIEDSVLKDTCTKKFIELEEISELTRYLCSDKARSVTGQSLIIAGGRG